MKLQINEVHSFIFDWGMRRCSIQRFRCKNSTSSFAWSILKYPTAFNMLIKFLDEIAWNYKFAKSFKELRSIVPYSVQFLCLQLVIPYKGKWKWTHFKLTCIVLEKQMPLYFSNIAILVMIIFDGAFKILWELIRYYLIIIKN